MLDPIAQQREVNVTKYNQRLIRDYYAATAWQKRARISQRYRSQLEFSDEELDYLKLWEWPILFHLEN